MYRNEYTIKLTNNTIYMIQNVDKAATTFIQKWIKDNYDLSEKDNNNSVTNLYTSELQRQ